MVEPKIFAETESQEGPSFEPQGGASFDEETAQLQESVPSVSRPQPLLRHLARKQLREGNTVEGAEMLLEHLHGLPDVPESIDDLLPSLRLLSFTLCALLPDEELLSFLDSLQPEQYPIDNLVRIWFTAEFTEYAEGRSIEGLTASDFMDKRPEFVNLLQNLAESPSPLTRTWAVAAQAATSIWDINHDSMENPVIKTMNQLAVECPNSLVTRELFRELAFRSLAPMWPGQEKASLETVNAHLAETPWNESVSALIRNDDVSQAIFGAAATRTAEGNEGNSEAVIDAASIINDTVTDLEARDWSARQLVASLRQSDLTESSKADALNALEEILATANELDGAVGLDVARAQMALFNDAGASGRKEDARQYLDSLLIENRITEPVEANFDIHLTAYINNYASSLVNNDDYCEAIYVWQRLAEAYPNSYLALACESNIENIQGLCQ